MNCPICRQSMQDRNGRYGLFHVCKAHGTISIKNNLVVSTGAIFDKLKNSQFVPKAVRAYAIGKPIDLDFEVRKQAMMFGVEITELDRFIEGGEDAANDDPDHWMNLRPY